MLHFAVITVYNNCLHDSAVSTKLNFLLAMMWLLYVVELVRGRIFDSHSTVKSAVKYHFPLNENLNPYLGKGFLDCCSSQITLFLSFQIFESLKSSSTGVFN